MNWANFYLYDAAIFIVLGFIFELLFINFRKETIMYNIELIFRAYAKVFILGAMWPVTILWLMYSNLYNQQKAAFYEQSFKDIGNTITKFLENDEEEDV